MLLSCSNHKQVVNNNDLTSNCSEIIIFLENHNWQKHTNKYSGAVYYSIDRCSLKSFANFLNKHKCELRSVDEMRQLFGSETYKADPSEGSFQEIDSLATQFFCYKIVSNNSLDLFDQSILEYRFKEKKGKIEFIFSYILEELDYIDD